MQILFTNVFRAAGAQQGSMLGPLLLLRSVIELTAPHCTDIY